MTVLRKLIRDFAVASLLLLLTGIAARELRAQARPYVVEWVYKVKLGHEDEFWKIFQKYQIAVLDKEKENGSVVRYEVFRPGLHTSEDHRWDFRVVIYYKDVTTSSGGSALEKQLFPDQATLKREEGRRWELTELHWDLPIRQIDPHAPVE
ncbi:MAG TPA: hypothetical protein VEF06_13165 [Bryobacteraceae bacterium]|nr:hypothetical protein [Bryobacteraceae bacterium]